VCATSGSCAYLGEKRGPDGLDIGEVGGLDEGVDLVGLLFPKGLVSITTSNCP
jgi:hypothetical protein